MCTTSTSILIYNLAEAKPKLIEFINSNYDDFGNDMMRDISTLAKRGGKESLDEIISIVNMIEDTNKTREKQIKIIQKATLLSEILAMADQDDMVGNILYEQEDKILSVVLGIDVEEKF